MNWERFKNVFLGKDFLIYLLRLFKKNENPGKIWKYNWKPILQIVCLSIVLPMTTAIEGVSAWPVRPDSPRWKEKAPYGDYCPDPRWGWYGARKRVLTLKEAETILSTYFSRYRGVKIVNIREKRRFFIAEIRNENDTLLDVVILDKRTGRIRSIY